VVVGGWRRFFLLWLMWWLLVVNVWNGEGWILWEKISGSWCCEIVQRLINFYFLLMNDFWLPFLFATQSLFIVAMR
jgi:hypothetical protein